MKKITIIAFVVILALLSGAEGCDDAGGGSPRRTLGPTVNPPPVPRPQPDHGATPNPKNGDPAPHDPVHNYTIWATWTPAANFVEIDWVIGTDDGPALGGLQRSGGHFSKSGQARRSGTVYIEVVAYSGTKAFPIEIHCWITEDGKNVPGADQRKTVQTKPRGNDGVTCTVPD